MEEIIRELFSTNIDMDPYVFENIILEASNDDSDSEKPVNKIVKCRKIKGK